MRLARLTTLATLALALLAAPLGVAPHVEDVGVAPAGTVAGAAKSGGGGVILSRATVRF